MSNLYIIAGPNGAGKTTAAFTILPHLFNCKEFVNADNIAAGLSPFNPENAAFEAGRIMLQRIRFLVSTGIDFALETTLATKSYVPFIKEAQQLGYEITLVFFWLPSFEVAKERVKMRVSEGGHNIPPVVIERRYQRGIDNFFQRYIPICDNWLLINNANLTPQLIARGGKKEGVIIIDELLWQQVLKQNKTDE
ncbi:MAG: zeta toxin [Runella slithyformis]|nr:MAG: zeta toxin [Runella slithyformis]TAF31948.1 MAG: zeta toxin [Cytophagales bacterium]